MHYPQLAPIPTEQSFVDAFRGYNCNSRIGPGEFTYMENLSSDGYPVLSPRRPRGLYANPASPQGLIAKEKLCYVDGADFVIGQDRISMDLSTAHGDNPKQLISMGAYVLIFPDKKYINTAAPEDFGSMEAHFTAEGVTLAPCDAQAAEQNTTFTQPQTPENPGNGDLWLDTSVNPPSLKQWSAATAVWTCIESTYVKLSAPGMGKDFSACDGVSLTGLPDGLPSSAVIQARGEDYLVIPGLLSQTQTLETPVTVSRVLPRLDFVVECGNRLWGCRYGTDETGQPVNRLYASRLGDFRNWNCFQGISTDSYYVSLGTDGPFTGAVNYLGSPLFFKENCLHRIFGSLPSDFSVQDTPCRGVQPGCHRSLAIVGETLFYKSRSGVFAFDGSLPRLASFALGTDEYTDAVAGAHAGKYYISMAGQDGHHLFAYDTARSLWHREDDLMVTSFASHGGELYAIDGAKKRILALLGSGEPIEERVQYLAQTGELGLSSPEMKYISRITLRLYLAPGSTLTVDAQYDGEDTWEPLAVIHQSSLRSFTVPIRPRRCDFLRLRFRGEGDMKLYSLAKTIEKGSVYSR